jgi:hypothetical protein
MEPFGARRLIIRCKANSDRVHSLIVKKALTPFWRVQGSKTMNLAGSTSTRLLAFALSGALVASLTTPASAAPIPVAKSFDAPSILEPVQYRAGRGPVRAKRRGNNGAAVAAIIGAVAIGAAAIAASNAEKRRQRRAEQQYYYDSGYPYEYGYAQPAPQPYYVPAPQPQYYGGGYYQPQPQPRWRHRQAQQLDGSSPYIVQQQRVQRRGYPDSSY